MEPLENHLPTGQQWTYSHRDIVNFDMSWITPTLKIASFAVITIVCQPEFRTDKINELVVYDNTTIVIDRAMPNRPNSSVKDRGG